MTQRGRTLLELRPNCEYCDKDLPPDSGEAWICTYECTFCTGCVENILHNVCPNCGGGFARRPIRPVAELRKGVGLTHQPASTERVYLKYSQDEVTAFVAGVKDTPPEHR